MYKFLRKDLVQHIRETFSLIAPLLHDRHEYIRAFMGPGFAYLLRKVQDKDLAGIVSDMLESLTRVPQDDEQAEAYKEGLAVLFFETIKGPRSTLHSKGLSTLKALFQAFDARSPDCLCTLSPNYPD